MSEEDQEYKYKGGVREQYRVERWAHCSDCAKKFSWKTPKRGPGSRRRYGRCAECAERQWYWQRRLEYESYRRKNID